MIAFLISRLDNSLKQTSFRERDVENCEKKKKVVELKKIKGLAGEREIQGNGAKIRSRSSRHTYGI